MNLTVAATILIGSLSAVLVAAVPGHGSSHQLKLQKLIEGAKAEGDVDIVATWRPVEANAIFEGFKRAYPFIKIRQTAMAGVVGFERIRAEFASGRRTTDLVSASAPEYEKAGMLETWPDWFEVFPETNKRTVHPSLFGVLEPPSVYGLIYRSDLVPRDLQPLTYAKLSDPRFAGGKLAFNMRQYYHWGIFYPKWNDEEIIRYAKEVLVPQKPKLCSGNGECWEMLARGETWALPALGAFAYFSRYLPKGVKNIAIASDDAAVDEGKPIIFLKNAPHPNAAKIFLHWITTSGAQEIFAKHRGRADPYDPSNVVGAWVKKHNAKLFDHPAEAREERSRELGAMVLQMLGVPIPQR
jgi:iron(III) transport system substrate-binding protein